MAGPRCGRWLQVCGLGPRVGGLRDTVRHAVLSHGRLVAAAAPVSTWAPPTPWTAPPFAPPPPPPPPAAGPAAAAAAGTAAAAGGGWRPAVPSARHHVPCRTVQLGAVSSGDTHPIPRRHAATSPTRTAPCHGANQSCQQRRWQRALCAGGTFQHVRLRAARPHGGVRLQVCPRRPLPRAAAPACPCGQHGVTVQLLRQLRLATRPARQGLGGCGAQVWAQEGVCRRELRGGSVW
mmetsp:Transcript_27446/g.56671  ORF Transcript_27446/g.56671 Transcript_27446/m.56671 type:complete len:235 (+) Transcript_27446:1198-1902(+)